MAFTTSILTQLQNRKSSQTDIILYLTITAGVPYTTCNELIEQYHISLSEWEDKYLDLLTQKEVKYFTGIAKSQSGKKKTSFEDSSEEIVEYLNSLLGVKRKVAKDTNGLIQRSLSTGCSIDDIKLVILYFFKSWINNPSMKQYIRLGTILNTKFETRLEAAKEFQAKFLVHQENVTEIVKKIKAIVIEGSKVAPSLLLSSSKQEGTSIIDSLTLSTVELFIYWLEKGYKPAEIADTIVVYIQTWKDHPRGPSMSLERVLNKEFPERAASAKRKRSETNKLKDWGEEND